MVNNFKKTIETGGYLLTEVKLSRIWKQLTDVDTTVGIITAFRGEYSYKENVKRNKELASTLKSNGFGYVYVDGKWNETDNDTGEKKLMDETSIFVTSTDDDKLFKLLKDLCGKYDQDGFSFKHSGESDKYIIYDRTGKKIVIFDNVKFNKLGEIYTSLRGSNGIFLFETCYTSGGWNIHMIDKGVKMNLSVCYKELNESNISKMVASDVKSKIEPLIDDSIESSGGYVSDTYGTDSKEFKAWDKVTTQMYDSILEYKNMMRKL